MELRSESEEETLEVRCHGEKTVLPTELLATYLRYARSFVQPKLSRAAKEMIQEFYQKMRGQNHTASGLPLVTTRQLEALIRLSEAAARAELHDIVERRHVQDVIEIVEATAAFAKDFHTGPETVVGKKFRKGSKNDLVRRLLSGLQRHAQHHNQQTFSMDDLKRVGAASGILGNNFNMVFNVVYEQDSSLLKVNGNRYRLNPSVI